MTNRILLALALAIVLVPGCKIIQQLPNGGEIASASGDRSCASVECTIDWDGSEPFDDSFSALPPAGHHFSGWKQAPRYMCGGSTKPCTLKLPANPLFAPDNTVYIEPVFVPHAENLAEALDGLGFAAAVEVSSQSIALRTPEAVIGYGLAEAYGLDSVELNNISFAYREETYDMWQVVRDYLDSVDRASLKEAEQQTWDVYSWLTDITLAEREFMHIEFPASYFITGVPNQDQTFFRELHPLETEQDARDYVARLALVDDKISQLIDNLVAAEARGVVQPSYSLGISAFVHRRTANTSLAVHPYYQRFSEDLGATGVNVQVYYELLGEASSIIANEINPAYHELADFLEAQESRAPAAIGVDQYPQGDAYYRQQLKFHTTSDLTPEEVHELGNREVARVQAELREHFDALGYPQNESLFELFSRVETDRGEVAAADVLPTYEAIVADAEQRLAPLFNRLPSTPVRVEGGTACCFYIRGSLDGTRSGAFFVTNTTPQPYFTMPSLAYHEAMPGHHLQIALEQELGLPSFYLLSQFTGYIEGWALYAERLADDYDWYENDPYGDIGRLNYELLRATRLVVDTGIHHYGWSSEQSIGYLEDNLGSSRSAAEGSVGRYSLWPGQATAYMVGMLEILDLRDQAMAAQGSNFNIADFHSLILEGGSMPLELLRQRVESALR